MRRPRRCRGDRGTAVLETALVAPVLLALVFGVLELGLAHRDILTADDAVADGARVGSQQGPDVLDTGDTADRSIVEAVRMATRGIDPSAIERIVVFEAGPPAEGSALAQVPQSCRTGASSGADRCNVYLASSAFEALDADRSEHFRCRAAGDPACGWNPAARIDGPTVADIEHLGVYVKVHHAYATGLFGSTLTIERAAVHRLEPGDISA